ncbi:MAG: hypothetical protein WCL32_13665 [Planctomycetota bacterium]
MFARFAFVLAVLAALVASPVQALELKNVRPSYGHLGATRQDATKFLPGDYLFISYDIDGLKLDDKNRASYTVLLEVFDANAKEVFKKQTPTDVIPQLGSNRVPGDLHVIMGVDQPTGKYTVRLTVLDRLSKEVKSFTHAFELLPKGFGVVGVLAPAVGFPANPYMLQYNLVELGLDAAKKPNAKLEMKIFDETGKPVAPAVVNTYPADLPEGHDLSKKGNIIPIDFPILPNRPGRFTIDITATDNVTQKTSTVRYPVTILDIPAISAK